MNIQCPICHILFEICSGPCPNCVLSDEGYYFYIETYQNTQLIYYYEINFCQNRDVLTESTLNVSLYTNIISFFVKRKLVIKDLQLPSEIIEPCNSLLLFNKLMSSKSFY